MTTPTLSPHSRKVLELLRRTKKPLSAYDILDKLKQHGLRAPPTVYRALDALEQKGLVHKIPSLNAFVACNEIDGHMHSSQFAICRSCGTAEEIHDSILMKAQAKIRQKFLQHIEHQFLEISGLCHNCHLQSS